MLNENRRLTDAKIAYLESNGLAGAKIQELKFVFKEKIGRADDPIKTFLSMVPIKRD